MNYFVTGAAGFIGFHTVKKLLENGDKVFGVDSINDYYDPLLKYARLKELGIETIPNSSRIEPNVRERQAAEEETGLKKHGQNFANSAPPREDFKDKIIQSSLYLDFIFARLELENQNDLFTLVETYTEKNGPFDRIIHLAAQAGVRYSLENPHAYTISNIEGFLNILELSRKIKIPHLVYASSSSVYGLNTKQPFSVNDEVNRPASLYAATKRSNELMAFTYSHLFGIPVTGLRFFTVYGPWGRPDMAYYKFSASIMKGETIEVFNSGDMYRDFTFVDDVCSGILLAAERPSLPQKPFALYNLGNNRPEKLLFFIETLEKVLGKKALIKNLPMQAGDVYSTAADIEETKKDLGWEPHTNIEEGLKIFAEWFKPYHKWQA